MTTPATPPARDRWKAQEAARDELKALDAAIAQDRITLDNLARMRQYRQMGKVAEVLAQTCRRAQETMERLDRLMGEANR